MPTIITNCARCGARLFGKSTLCGACLLETALAPLPDDAIDTARTDQPSMRPLRDFGDYELLEEIGRGGQGVVYRARQRSLNRTVALKVIGLGHFASTPHLKRFRQEAEAAARLEHSQIVPIYEIGERDGACYFSMKFIDGGQLDQFIKREQMTPKSAAELLSKIARTVQFAHEHGILHRDIKPGNILLDRNGDPHLTDFGLARLIESDSTLTNSFDVLGTPSYMSPEQAAGQTKELTAASDIYSLGAVLYHMLAGEPPFAGGSTYETIRMVLESEPRNPRLRNSTVDVDLAAICLKCLEKDPAKRYPTTQALTHDLERWLHHQPISARPANALTRTRKWFRRNRTTTVLIACLLGLVALTVALAWIWQLRSQAMMKAEMATLIQGLVEYPKAEAQVHRVSPEADPAAVQEKTCAQLGKQLGVDPKLLREKLPRFADEVRNAPNIDAYERANASYVTRDYVDAERLALQAATEAQQMRPIDSKRLFASLTLAGLSAHRAIQYERATEHFKEAEKLTNRDRNLEEWVTLQHEIADLLVAQGNYGDAEKLIRGVIEVRARILGPEHPDTLDSRDRLIYALTRQSKFAEAEAEARGAIKLREQVLGPEHVDTTTSRYYLADVLVSEGKNTEAESLYRQMIPLIENTLGVGHQRALIARLGLATALAAQGKHVEAEPLYRQVIRLDEKVYGPQDPDTLGARQNLATTLQAEHKYSEAEAEYRDVITLQQKLIGPAHPDTLTSRNNLADCLDEEGNFVEAETECREIIPLEEKALGQKIR